MKTLTLGVGVAKVTTSPPDSIVVCAYCCATLLWDGEFSVATAEQIEGLALRDRARLAAIVAAQSERNLSRKSN